jgi:hypothetical protein
MCQTSDATGFLLELFHHLGKQHPRLLILEKDRMIMVCFCNARKCYLVYTEVRMEDKRTRDNGQHITSEARSVP